MSNSRNLANFKPNASGLVGPEDLDLSSGTTTIATADITNLAYTGTLTGGTGVVNLGSGQVYKDASGNVGIGTSLPGSKLAVHGSDGAGFTGITSVNSNANVGIAGVQFGSDPTYVKAAIGLLRSNANGVGSLVFYNDSNTDAANWSTGDEKMRIDSAGNVGIGTSSPTQAKLVVNTGVAGNLAYFTDGINTDFYIKTASSIATIGPNAGSTNLAFQTSGSERARIDSSGHFLMAKTALNINSVGQEFYATGITKFTANATVLNINRLTDGTLVDFYSAGTQEGGIAVSGTTISYIGGHLSRWAQTTTVKDESLVKGTVLSNLDEMNVYVAPTTYWTEEDELPEGVSVGDVKVETHTVDNEQLNKVKVSDVEGDANVAGVFVNWDYDEAHSVDEINMAMTGDMIIRIAAGTTVARGDLLMSTGDGTAKPQGDDIVRSKTIAKVTSTHVTCTYEDGSYCVPCVLMAC